MDYATGRDLVQGVGELRVGPAVGLGARVELVLLDGSSRARVVAVSLALEDLARMLLLRDGVDCRYEFWPAAPVGKRLERRMIDVSTVPPPLGMNPLDWEHLVHSILDVYEGDGWFINRSCVNVNSYQKLSDTDNKIPVFGLRVCLYRFVDSSPETE